MVLGDATLEGGNAAFRQIPRSDFVTFASSHRALILISLSYVL
jgi:hypothetical protein